MKKILLILFLLPLMTQAQRLQHPTIYGYEFSRVRGSIWLGLPNDTFAIDSYYRDSAWAAVKNNTLYLWHTVNHNWVASGGSSTTPGLQDVLAVGQTITTPHTVTFGKQPLTMTWNTLENDDGGLVLYSNSTATGGFGQAMLLKVIMEGVNANINQTTYTAVYENLHSGTGSFNIGHESNAKNGDFNIGIEAAGITGTAATSTNIGGQFSASGAGTNTAAKFDASGGTTNYAADFNTGLVKISTLPTGASTDSIMTYEASTGIVRKRNVASIAAGSVPISGLTAAGEGNIIDNTTFGQAWDWTGLAGAGLVLGSSSTAAAGNNHSMLVLSVSGANSNSTQTTYGMRSTNTHTGTSSTNIAGYFSASGGTVNNALYIAGGAISINGSAGTSGQVLTSAGANTLPTWSTPSSGGITINTTAITGGTTGTLLYDNAATVGKTTTITTDGTYIKGRWRARVDSVASSATPTINSDNVDIFKITALAANISNFSTNLSGTPQDGDILELVITGTAARTISWGASFVSTTVTLPATTVTTATLTVIVQYYKSSSYGNNLWHCVNSY